MNKGTFILILGLMLFILIAVLGYPALQTVAGPLFAPPPSPPPPPTGPLPPRAPTFDVSRLKPPPPPPTIVIVKGPTIPPLKVITPASDWVTYRDPRFGFSLQYPANWYFDTKRDFAISNYDPDSMQTKGGSKSDLLKIGIGVEELARYGTLDNWVAQRKQQYDSNIFNGVPEFSYSPLEHLTVNNVPAIRWTIKGPMSPEGGIQVVLGQGKWLFFLDASPATSNYIPVFDRIVA